MSVDLKPGNGKCGHCGTKMEEHTKGAAVLVLCPGCGIVCGKGDEAKSVVDDYIASGKARRIEAVPGIHAMRLIGGPSA